MRRGTIIIVICIVIISAAITSIIGLYPTIENGEVVMKTPNSILITTDKSEYKIGESILIKMKNIGGNSLETNSMPVGFTVYDDHDNQMKTWLEPLE
ncbi:MAG: hypothetical protein HZA82_06040 [Thaumarchaeota archaeon]|nr:hypothetical protein [Nitrososphaerota archaeon]